MPYYFSGSYSQPLKIRLNVDQLFSMYHEEKIIKQTIEYKRTHPEYTAKIFMDSGAFSHFQNAKKKGIVLTDKDVYEYTDKYLKFLNEWGDDLECFVGVDTVPDPNNVDPEAIKKTWANYLYMYERLKPSIRHKLIPVFHFGEDFEELKKWLEFRHPDGSKIEYLGLAISLEGVKKVRIAWGQECRRIIEASSNPNVKTHAFGVGVKSVMEHIDVTSTDATSWLKRAAYGMISVDDQTVYVSEIQESKSDGRHFKDKSTAFQETVLKRIEEGGFRLSPEVVPYKQEGDTFTFSCEDGDVTAVKEFNTLHVKFADKEVDYKETDTVEGALHSWETKDKSFITFNRNGTVSYDNSKCLATNCYARAEFNILDTLAWYNNLTSKKHERKGEKVSLW